MTRQAYTDRELLDVFPWVSWRDPQVMTTVDGTWLVCRFCVAQRGIRAEEVPDRGFTRLHDFESHLRHEHPEVTL